MIFSRKLSLIFKSLQDTLETGRYLGELLEAGDVVALIGELGCGKTYITKGIAQGLGISDHYCITSPSFTIINEYQGEIPLYHIDLYRMERGFDEDLLGLKDYLYSPGVTVVEWAEKLSRLPRERIEIHMEILGEQERRLEITGYGDHPASMVKRLHDKKGSTNKGKRG